MVIVVVVVVVVRGGVDVVVVVFCGAPLTTLRAHYIMTVALPFLVGH